MADLRDEYGNPIQLTDQHGNPVQLTDEFGNPMQLSGVAKHGEPTGAMEPSQPQLHPEGESRELRRSSSSSSSSSSEDDGQGGRRKKKGLKEKIKEKLPGHKHDEGDEKDWDTSGAAEQQEHREKKSVMDKIKEKLPGHHGSSH